MGKSITDADLKGLASEELEALLEKVSNQLEAQKEEELENAREECQAIAEGVGHTVESLFGFRKRRGTTAAGGAKPRRASKAEAKYRNPDNADETWSGRGRRPKWFDHQVEVNGVSPDDMLIS